MTTARTTNFFTPRPGRAQDSPLEDINDLGFLTMSSSPNQKRNNYRNQQQQRKLELLQNCDLPPPTKILFSPTDKTADSMNRALFRDYPPSGKGDDELELLRAVRLSQTRAREAEMKRVEMEREKRKVACALEGEAMKVFGYRQMVRILEFEVGVLKEGKEKDDVMWREVEVEEDEMSGGGGDGGSSGGSGFSWAVAVALCLGAVGVGFAFGCSCRYLF